MARHRNRRGVLRPALTGLAVVTLTLSGASAVTWALAGPERPVAEARTLLRAISAAPPASPPAHPARAGRGGARAATTPPLVPAPTRKVRPRIQPDPRLSAEDVRAGLLDLDVIQRGTGRFDTVPGTVKAPGRGRVHTVRVQVEQGLNVDADKFAAFVMATLNNAHSWGAGGRMTFARTDGRSDVRVVLATPVTSERMCRPLNTGGTLSCRNGDAAILTMYRWVRTVPDYGADRSGYRYYLVNHEVGHWLGHGHVSCPGRGRRAPVMMQQTKGLRGCTPNPWPNP